MIDSAGSLRRTVGELAARAGLDHAIKNTLLGVYRATEGLSFALSGRPNPSDAIVLAGSGRSGTTWLADLLTDRSRIQQVFEPLNPAEVPEAASLTGWESEYRHHIATVYLRPGETSPGWEQFLEQSLNGRVRNWWTESGRTTSFPNGFLVKLIRANLMLGFIYDVFEPRIVLLMRHPCAVVASRLRGSWHADVDELINQDALVEDYLEPWLPDIRRERDELGAHAVWWAVENAVALRELSSRPHHLVLYEDLVMAPRYELQALRDWLGLPTSLPRAGLGGRPSRTTRPAEQSGSARERVAAWQAELSHDDKSRILGWAERFGIDLYSDAPTPIHRRTE